jgi:hypothetical protein
MNPRNMGCFRCIIVNSLHKGGGGGEDDDDDDDDDDNNNNNREVWQISQI